MNSDVIKPMDWSRDQNTDAEFLGGKPTISNSCAWSSTTESGDTFHGDVFGTAVDLTDCCASTWRQHQSLGDKNSSCAHDVNYYANYATGRPQLMYHTEGYVTSCQENNFCYNKVPSVSSECELVCSPTHMSQGFYDWLNSYCPETCVRKRNQRERERVRCVNEGYARLLRHLPSENKQKRLSKVETLRKAIQYIKHLQQVLQAADNARPNSKSATTEQTESD